jgi:hypothetical protein
VIRSLEDLITEACATHQIALKFCFLLAGLGKYETVFEFGQRKAKVDESWKYHKRNLKLAKLPHRKLAAKLLRFYAVAMPSFGFSEHTLRSMKSQIAFFLPHLAVPNHVTVC